MSINHEICQPSASAQFQAVRAYGYDIPRAIADIIDNSITASAKNVYIVHHFNESDPNESQIAIIDDGNGMNEKELFNGMRLHSKNPLQERAEHDLGRFGLGLKTASLSQCKILTVRSKKDNDDNTRCWDLDYVEECDEYRLIKGPRTKESKKIIDLLNTFDNGTLVLWENLQQDFEESDEDNEEHFERLMSETKAYCELVFHRFIGLEGNLNIFLTSLENFNKSPLKLKAVDPFLKNKSEIIGPELMDDNAIKATTYILPYHSKLSEIEKKQLDSINGRLKHQGFYVYRNKRLLLPGGWLNLGFNQHGSTNLSRIALDLPNNVDIDWKLDVTKSEVIPPNRLRKPLKKLAQLAIDRSKNVLTHKARSVTRRLKKDTFMIWNISKVHNMTGKYEFKINRNHVLIKDILNQVKGDKKLEKAVDSLIKLAENKLPVDLISSRSSEDLKDFEFERKISEDVWGLDLIEKFNEQFKSHLNNGLSSKDAFYQVLAIEPFDEFKADFESIKKNYNVAEDA